MHLNDIITPV